MNTSLPELNTNALSISAAPQHLLAQCAKNKPMFDFKDTTIMKPELTKELHLLD